MFDKKEKPIKVRWFCTDCHLQLLIDREVYPPQCPRCGSKYYAVHEGPANDLTFDRIEIPEEYHDIFDEFRDRIYNCELMMTTGAEQKRLALKELFAGIKKIMPEPNGYEISVAWADKIVSPIGLKKDRE